VDLDTACAGEHMVCDCRPEMTFGDEGLRFTCTRPGVCRVNHTPVAVDFDVRHPWKSPCVPATAQGYDYDYDPIFFRLVTLPKKGFLEGFISSSRADGATARAIAPALEYNSFGNPPGWSTGVPSPVPAGSGDCSPPKQCPEGWYQAATECWVPNQPTFTGFDAFTFSVVDMHGAESETVTFTIEIFEGR
jgi:hypothetical protein